MSQDEHELMQAAIAAPEDMAPRLDLAELWGGDRGAFVRAQIATSDSWRAGANAGRAMIEAERLLRGKRRAWAGPIADHVHEVRFLRGFPEWIVVEASTFARDWEQLFALAPVRHVDLAHARAVIGELVDCPGLERIVGLSFNLFATPLNDPIGADAAIALAASPRLRALRYLNVGDSKLSETAMAALTRSPHLAGLEVGLLHGNAVPDFREDIGADYDGTILDVRPSESMAAFERRHGRCEWLHSSERRRRTVAREEF